MKKYIAAISLVLLCAVSNVYAAAVTVSPDIIIKNTEPFGYGKDWTSGYSYINGNTESLEPSDMFINNLKKADVQIPLYRIGGDSSNTYYWKSKVGALESRSHNDFVKNEGYVEWLRAIYKITPDAQMVVVLNLNDTVENNKDLIRFLTLNPDDANAVGSDGTNWPQLRVDMGITEPVKVYAFELGNELYPKDNFSAEHVTTEAEKYAAICADVLPQLKAVNTEAKFSVLLNSIEMISYADNVKDSEMYSRIWNEIVINTVKNQIDYVTHHDYFGAQKTNWVQLCKRDEYYDVIYDYIDGTDIKILLSESGTYHSGVRVKLKWGNISNSDGDDLIIDNSNQLGFALGMGRFLIKAYSMPKVAAVIQYGFTNTEDNNLLNDDGTEGPGTEFWTYYRYCTDHAYRVSAIGLVGDIFAKAALGTPIKTEMDSADICAQAFKQENGNINLVMIPDFEMDTVDNTVTLSKLPGYTPYSMYVVSGDSYFSDNTSQTPDGVKTYVQKLSPDTQSITIPAYSAVSVLYKPDGSVEAVDNVGEMRIYQDNTLLEITDTLYKGHGLENGTLMSLVILKGDTAYEDTTEENIVAYGQAELLNGISYFKTSMPIDAEEGTYRAVVGNGNVVHSVTFEYGSRINPVKSVLVTCDNGKINANVQFEPSDDKTYTVSAIYGEFIDEQLNDKLIRRAVVMDSFDKNSDSAVLSFDMPEGAIPGKYTLVISSDDQMHTSVFEYARPDDKVRITTIPINAEGNEVFIIEDCFDVKVNVKNVSSDVLSVNGILAYFKDNKLVKVQTYSEDFDKEEANDLLFDGGRIIDADYVKLMFWDKSFSKPYSGVFYIK